MFAALEGENAPSSRNLERMCSMLGLKPELMHNAGNDAYVRIFLLSDCLVKSFKYHLISPGIVSRSGHEPLSSQWQMVNPSISNAPADGPNTSPSAHHLQGHPWTSRCRSILGRRTATCQTRKALQALFRHTIPRQAG
jgi:hypothetical protein